MFFLWGIMAVIVAMVAHSKNQRWLPWFFYGLLIWPIALVHILLLKEDTIGETHNYIHNPSNTTTKTVADKVKCPHCGALMEKNLAWCRKCQKKLPKQNNEIPDLRECPFCAELIKSKAIKCKHCGSAVEAISTDSDQ